jgi:hypothetical protein
MEQIEAWKGDWRARLRSRLHARGFDSALAYAAARPAVPIPLLAEELGPTDVVGVQVQDEMLAEAQRRGLMEWLVRDLLARYLVEAIGEGWPNTLDERSKVRIASALARWSAFLPERYREGAILAGKALLASPPSDGWKPVGPEDHVILALIPGGASV